MIIHWYLPPGTGLTAFDDSWPENQGLGGAEATVVYMTRAWAKMGHEVVVYGSPPVPMFGHGVRYELADMFSPTDDRDVFIQHRTPMHQSIRGRVQADVKLFFSCDQATVGRWSQEVYPYVDKVIAISEYHKQYLYLYQNLKRDMVYVTDLGVNTQDYKSKRKKIKNKLIFCSVPERGLEYALDYFREVVARVPDAELVVTSDHRLWGAPYTGLSDVMLAVAKGSPNVTYLGKISRKELIKHQQESEIMFYPCTYDENFCISAAECQYAGAVPVTTAIGALRTTVQDGITGRTLNITPLDEGYRAQFVDTVVGLLENPAELERLRQGGIDRATRDFPWETIAHKWLELIDTIKEEKYGKR